MSNYNIELIALTLLIGYFAVMLTFNLSKKLHQAQPNERNLLLAYATMTVGSSLWAFHFINELAFPLTQSTGYSLAYILLSWLSALALSAAVLYVSSQETLPLKLLLPGGGLTTVSGILVLFFSICSMQIEPNAVFSPAISLLAVISTFGIAIIGILVLFWLKNYTSKHSFLTKSMIAIIISMAITGLHLTYNAALVNQNQAFSNNLFHFDDPILGLAVALGFICLFLVSFIIAIFYDKVGYDTFKFNLFRNEDHEKMSQLALLDTLTQLPNRRALMQHLEAAIRRSDRNGTSFAVAFVDIDNFKQINDSLGHQMGDGVLQKVAKKLVAAVRGCDEVSRIGGDEFIALIEEIESGEDCTTIVERMVSSVREVCIINHSEVHVTVSIGVSMYPMDGNIEQLISAADTAMYRAKKDGKNQFRFYDAEISLASDQLLEMQYDLKNALANDEFKLHYQIKIDSITRAPIGAEALLRWEHPVKGLLYPADFMQSAERFGLSYVISDWVIEESCRTLHYLNYLKIPFSISINLSHQQISNTNLVNDITAMMQRFDLPSTSLIFEITESTASKNKTLFNNQLARFQAANIKVSIDDFDSQSSSLANLQNYQVSELKLDPSFILKIDSDYKTRGIVQAIIELAHVLKLNVVAEGVETEGQRKTLAEIGCDQMQGYLISRPLPEERLIGLLKNLNLRFEENGQFLVEGLKKL